MLIAAVAFAAAQEGAAPTPALAAIEAGDAAWWAGHRAAARRAWREALRAADDTPIGHAAEAMARTRLLQVGGNFAPFVHEAPLRRALADCPEEEPWCAIAEADAELFLPAFTGADPSRVPGILAGNPLVGPAAARIAIATGDRAALDALPGSALDAMGAGIRDTGRLRPEAPGTWVFGLSISGAPGAGVGVAVRFVDPDLASRGHRLEVVASGDTRGGVAGSALVVTATKPAFYANVGGGRTVGDRWIAEERYPYALRTLRAAAGVAPRWGEVGLTAGLLVRDDAIDEHPGDFVFGSQASLSLGDPTGDLARVSVEGDWGVYAHLVVGTDWRTHPRIAGGTLALRGLATYVPTTETSPFYRLPSAGGTELLRGLPAGRYRADTLVAAQAEYRHPIVGPLSAAAFVDTASIEGFHVTAGLGLRLALPPERYNIMRLDVGFGPEGWGVVAAWGEAF